MAANPLKIIFMGTPDFALPALKAIHASAHELLAVYTQPPRPAGRGQKERPSPVHQFAMEHNLPVHTPLTFKDADALTQLQSYGADLAVVVAYGMLLPASVLESFPKGCINIHPSKLPRWRGAAPLQRTIMAGDSETETNIMQMDQGLDTGDILNSAPYTIPAACTTGQLHNTMAEAATAPLLLTLEQIAAGTATRTPQSADGITYAKKIDKAESRINWAQTAHIIDCHIRGLNPMPGASFGYGDIVIKIWQANTLQGNKGEAAGTVLNNPLRIACADGYILPTELQWPGKKRMPVEDALRGHTIPEGTVLS